MSIENIPPEVRLLCWEYLSVQDYGSLAMTCRAFEHDRRHLDPTRFVCIQSLTTETALQRSRVLHRKDPVVLRLETSLPSNVLLPAVTELQVATRVPVVLCAYSFPNVQSVNLQNNTTFRNQQQMGRLFQSLHTLVIQDNDHLYLSGHDLRDCKVLQTLILQNCVLQLTDSDDHEALTKLDFLSWIKAPLRNVTLDNVLLQCPSELQTVSQDMLMNFVRRRPQLLYFKSDDLTEENKAILRAEFPRIQVV